MNPNESATDLYMIEEIIAKSNTLVLANYIFGEKVEVTVSDERIEFYSNLFDEAIENNMFLFVEYDVDRGVIIGK